MLRAGFTTVRDLGATGYANVAIAQAIEEGLCPGPRVLAAGASLTVTGGHGDSYYRPGVSVPREGMVAGPVAAREAVRQMVRMRADVIKLLVTGGVMTDGSDVGALQWTQEELQAAIEQAHRLGRRVAGHCHGAAGVVAAVRVGLDTVEHGTMLDEEAIGLMAERGTFLVPTLVAGQTIVEHGTAAGIAAHVVRKAVQVVEWHRKSVSRAREAGVRVAFGTDCGTPFNRAGRNGTELALMVACGFSPAEALRAATSVAAQALGLAEEIGTVEPGKAADLLVVAGDPLADVGLLADGSHVAWVVKAGRVVRRPDSAGGPGDD